MNDKIKELRSLQAQLTGHCTAAVDAANTGGAFLIWWAAEANRMADRISELMREVVNENTATS